MSEARDIIAEVITERLIWSGDVCLNLTTGRSFTGEVEPIQDIELNSELGRDPREQVLLHVADRVAADEIAQATKIRIPLLGVSATFTVVRRSDNPSDPQVEFGLMKVTTKDS